jgi:hypothetical protein
MKRSYSYVVDGVYSWGNHTEDVLALCDRKNSEEDPALATNSRLILLPKELLDLILSFMPPRSLQLVCQALCDVLSIETQKIFLSYSPFQTEYLTLMARHLALHSSLVEYAQESRFKEITSCDSLMPVEPDREYNIRERAKADQKLEAVGRILTAPFFDLAVFLNSVICECCEEGLCQGGVRSSMALPPLCKVCEGRLMRTLRRNDGYQLRHTNNDYVWISNKETRHLCAVPHKVTVSSFAKERNIRSTGARDGGEHFLLKDLLPYCVSDDVINLILYCVG